MSMGSLDTDLEPIALLVPESRSKAASRDLGPSSITASTDNLAYGNGNPFIFVHGRSRHPTEFHGGKVCQPMSNISTCSHQQDPRCNSINSDSRVNKQDNSLSSMHQYEKPRSLSGMFREKVQQIGAPNPSFSVFI